MKYAPFSYIFMHFDLIPGDTGAVNVEIDFRIFIFIFGWTKLRIIHYKNYIIVDFAYARILSVAKMTWLIFNWN